MVAEEQYKFRLLGMHILICSATEFEITPIVNYIRNKKPGNIDILITGIGLAAATYQLTKAIYTRKPELLIQAGIAGALDQNLVLQKVVVVKNEMIGDLGVEEKGKFHSLFDLKLQEKDHFPWLNGCLGNDLPALTQLDLPVVNAVTINEISTNKERIRYYKNLGADIESMEGAALHYTALMEKIPFLQIRSLSNFAGERDKTKWLLKEAITNLNRELERVLLKLMN